MLNVFIINPTAGGGKAINGLVTDIQSYFLQNPARYKLEYTTCPGDGVRIARRYAQSGENVRLFACGGDGTLHEVVNGIVGYKNVEIGVFPCGTGNDYCATYGDKEEFLNIENQIKGSAVPVDLVEYEGIYSINQCSIGFDALVVSKMNQVKNKPVIGGRLSYVTGLILAYFNRLGHDLRVEIDDKEAFSGEFLFTIAAKGKYHGGGFKSAPSAEPSNGKLNFMLVRKVGHLRFLKLLPEYIKGEHLKYKDVVINQFGDKLHVFAKKPLPITLDGELVYSEDFCVCIVKDGARFILPSTVVAKTQEKLQYKVTV